MALSAQSRRALPALEDDPLSEIIGMVQGGPHESSLIDEVVYGDLGRS